MGRAVVIAVVIAVAVAAAVPSLRDRSRGAVLPPAVRVGTDTAVSGPPRNVESEAAIAVDPAAPHVLLAGANMPRRGTMAVFTSTDGGRSWHHGVVPPAPHQCGASDPAVAIGTGHRQYYAFLSLACRNASHVTDHVYVATRRSAHARWHVIAAPVEPGGRFVLLDDRPSLFVDNGARSVHRGRIYLAWTRMTVDPDAAYVSPEEVTDFQPVAAEAVLVHSDDGGRTWTRPVVLSAENTPLEVRGATAADGTVYVTWREQASGSIWLTSSVDGERFVRRAFVAGARVDPAHSCGGFRARIPAQPRRCVSPNPVVSVDVSAGPRAGDVYVTWGTTGLNGSQDVEVAAFDPSLEPLLGVGHVAQVGPTEGLRGRDQFLAASTVDAAGRVWACFYQTTRVVGASAVYTCTVSADGGRTWAAPTPAASIPSDETTRRADRGNGFGDYEGIGSARGIVYTVWTDGRSLPHGHERIVGAQLTIASLPLPRR